MFARSSQSAGTSRQAHPVGRQELLQVGARLLLRCLRISSSPLGLLPQLCRLPRRVIACDNEQGGMSASSSSILKHGAAPALAACPCTLASSVLEKTSTPQPCLKRVSQAATHV